MMRQRTVFCITVLLALEQFAVFAQSVSKVDTIGLTVSGLDRSVLLERPNVVQISIQTDLFVEPKRQCRQFSRGKELALCIFALNAPATMPTSKSWKAFGIGGSGPPAGGDDGGSTRCPAVQRSTRGADPLGSPLLRKTRRETEPVQVLRVDRTWSLAASGKG
jgi:hypothetical protein